MYRDTTLSNYFYLSDGTKTGALKANGSGLLYRGPFVYRRGSDGSLTFESASFSGGRLTSGGALLYVTDYLGSVRAVVNGSNGAIYKASDYSTFGSESEAGAMQTTPIPSILTLRDGYTGKETQTPDFTTGYTDFGARQYSPALRRWMTPDPLSEKYYDVSPYAFCNNNPVNFVDRDGEAIDILWDIASIGMGVSSFVQNVRSGNISGAIGDGLGVLVDVAAAAVPFIPGGVGAVRAGAKAVGVIDNVTDAARTSNTLEASATSVKTLSGVSDSKIHVTYTKTNKTTGEVYSGRASGKGSPQDVVKKRDANHHKNSEGYGPAVLDKSSTNSDAIRGQEQYLIDANGGAKSQRGSSGNAINGISNTNPKKQIYEEARRNEFGN